MNLLVDGKVVRTATGRNDNHKMLFSLAVFEEWLRIYEEPVVSLSR